MQTQLKPERDMTYHRAALMLCLCSFVGCGQSEPPKPVFDLPEPAGWTHTEPRTLPPQDVGFSVAYEHTSGVTVTLYQFTREWKTISGDLDSAQIQGELENARAAILGAAKLGLWDDAVESGNGRSQLGTSAREAVWSRFTLTIDGQPATSDIYIWVHSNTLFKLRCTSHSDGSPALDKLLTAFGEACSD